MLFQFKKKLRENIEIIPAGDGKFIIRDPMGYTDSLLVVSQLGVLLAAMLDGTRTENDIVRDLTTNLGVSIPQIEIEKIINTLDEHGFLETPRFFELKVKSEQEFRLSLTREPALQDISYPSNVSKLKDFIEEILNSENDSISRDDWTIFEKKKLISFVSPHIEIKIGRSIYSRTYNTLRKYLRETPDVFIIFGTSHLPTNNTFSLTEKSFNTPFGFVKVAREISDEIIKRLGDEVTKDEIIHKKEHSIEFQVIFLRYIFGDKFNILPILCSADEIYRKNTIDYERLKKMKEGIEEGVQKGGYKRAVFLAAADLAHKGLRFGDEKAIDRSDSSLIHTKDILTLDYVKRNNAEGFLKDVMSDMNARRICGLAPIYTTLKMIDDRKTEGKIVGWDIWIDNTGSAVSFGSVFIFENAPGGI